MKLFILNREAFERTVFDTRPTHIAAFNQLHASVSCGNIPILIHQDDQTFEFKSVKDDVYYYNFIGGNSDGV